MELVEKNGILKKGGKGEGRKWMDVSKRLAINFGIRE